MRKLSLLFAGAIAVGLAWTGIAAEPTTSDRTSEHPILDRIDQFGRNLFGGGDAKQREAKEKERERQREADSRANRPGAVRTGTSARSGSPQGAAARPGAQPERVARASAPADRVVEQSTEMTTTPRAGSAWGGAAGVAADADGSRWPQRSVAERPNADRALPERASLPRTAVEPSTIERSPVERFAVERPAADRPMVERQSTVEPARPPVLRPATEAVETTSGVAARAAGPTATQLAGDGDYRTVMRPSGANALHQRLSGFRRSAFDESPSSAAAGPTASDTSPRGSDAADGSSGTPTEGAPARVAASAREASTGSSATPMTTPSARQSAAGTATPSGPPGFRPMSGVDTSGQSIPTAPVPAPATATPARGASVAVSPPDPTSSGGDSPRDNRDGTDSAASNDGAAGKPSGDGVLFTRQSPVIQVETVGARKISVGKESAYEVLVRNTGNVAAEQVAVTIDLPEWIDVLAAEASAGSTSSEKAREGVGEFRWKVGRVEAKARERLVLRIIPRQNRPFDLAVRWSHTPALSQAMIEVQEAKLNLTLHGPKEVLYGKGELYRLEVANAGNGDAENVVISLLPSTPGDKQPPASYRLGTVPAGQKKTIDIELTARQTGDLSIHVEARGDADVKAQLAEKIVVRRGALKVDVEAPKIQFVGSDATYRIRVSNPGTAPAVNPTITALIPAGTKFLGSPQKPQIASDRSRVTWMLETLPPGGETTVTMSCDATTPGISKLEVQAAAEGDLTASNTTSTQVEAIASLALKVDDPTGPVALESEAVYTLSVENRGTAAAEGVEVVAFFSTGFEPIGAEGGRYRVVPGQIVFERLASLGAGQNAQLKIRAKATAPGNHIFRVEVRSDVGSRLVREGTTRFYGEPGSAGSRAVAQPNVGQPGGQQPAMPQPGQAAPDRTAIRPEGGLRGDRNGNADPSMPPAAGAAGQARPQSR